MSQVCLITNSCLCPSIIHWSVVILVYKFQIWDVTVKQPLLTPTNTHLDCIRFIQSPTSYLLLSNVHIEKLWQQPYCQVLHKYLKWPEYLFLEIVFLNEDENTRIKSPFVGWTSKRETYILLPELETYMATKNSMCMRPSLGNSHHHPHHQ